MPYRLLNLVLLILLVAAGTAASLWYGRDVPVANPTPAPATPTAALPHAPDFTFTRLDGSSQKLSSLRGKIVLLNFWASWCAPCRVEFPQFLELAEHNKNVVILALSVDHDRAAMEKFLHSQDDEWQELSNVIIAHDPQKAIAQDLFQTIRYPETILIDAQGQIRRKYVGLEVEWDSPAFAAELSALNN